MSGTDYERSQSSSDCAYYNNNNTKEKKILCDGEKLPDQSSITDQEWISDMSKWPAILLSNIYKII